MKVFCKMKVRCLTNKINEKVEYEWLEEGVEYTVYGMDISIKRGCLCYYICTRVDHVFPMDQLACLFEVVDNRPSRYWILETHNSNFYLMLSFPEWSKEVYFVANLTDWEDREVGIFKRYRELMDFEFPDSSITEYAQVGDEKWLVCPKCIDAWECDNDRDALVRCPLCETIYNNPRYKNEWPHLPL